MCSKKHLTSWREIVSINCFTISVVIVIIFKRIFGFAVALDLFCVCLSKKLSSDTLKSEAASSKCSLYNSFKNHQWILTNSRTVIEGCFKNEIFWMYFYFFVLKKFFDMTQVVQINVGSHSLCRELENFW